MLDDKWLAAGIAGFLIHHAEITQEDIVNGMITRIQRYRPQENAESYRARLIVLTRQRVEQWKKDSQ